MNEDHKEIFEKSIRFDILIEMILKQATLSTYDEGKLIFHRLYDIC